MLSERVQRAADQRGLFSAGAVRVCAGKEIKRFPEENASIMASMAGRGLVEATASFAPPAADRAEAPGCPERSGSCASCLRGTAPGASARRAGPSHAAFPRCVHSFRAKAAPQSAAAAPVPVRASQSAPSFPVPSAKCPRRIQIPCRRDPTNRIIKKGQGNLLLSSVCFVFLCF